MTLAASTSDIAALQQGQTLLIDDELSASLPQAHPQLRVSREFAGATIATHATATVAQIMSPLYLDTDTFPESAKIRGEYKNFYPAQIMYGYSTTAPCGLASVRT